MNDLLLHPLTKAQVERYLENPAQAIMLIAPAGSGKRTLAERIAIKVLGLQPSVKLKEHQAILYIQPVNRAIPINAVRDLQKRLQLKTIGQKPIRRVVIIESAHRMTTEAQNALLKLLEEPPNDTVFILTVISAQSVLPTIYSRSQHLEVKRPYQRAIGDFFNRAGFSEDTIATASRYSGNRLGLTHALLQEDTSHPLLNAVSQARRLLTSPLLDRLTQVDEWAKQKEELPDRLDTLERLCRAGLGQAAENDDPQLIRRWQSYYQAVYDAKASLYHNPNPKLLLTNLFLRLS